MRFSTRILHGSAAFKSENFRRLSLGAALNSAGMQGEQVVLGYMIYQLTGSSAWVGVSLALFFAPMLFIGVPAGAIADRFDKRYVLVCTELALLTLLAGFAVLLWLEQIALTGALVMSALSGSLRSIHQPARLSYAGSIAGPQGLLAALGMLSITSRFGQLIGAVAAGTISQQSGAGAAYAALAFGHMLALLAFYKTQANQSSTSVNQSSKSGIVHALTSGLTAMRTHTVLLMLVLLISLVEVFGFSFATALPEIAVERLAVGDAGLGTMHAMRAAGGLAGALLLSFVLPQKIGLLFLLVIIGFGAALFSLAIATQMVWVLVAIMLIALCASCIDILAQGMLQISVPPELRGRAMGAWVFALGLGPIGHLELGYLMSQLGTTTALLINSAVMVAIGVTAMLLVPAARTIRNQ